MIGIWPRPVEHLLCEDSFSNCPDILANSFYNVDTREVAAFAGLIGCHGGIDGYQTQPFTLYPATRQPATDNVVGAAAVYGQLKSWLNQFKPADAGQVVLAIFD